jgi:hypothetical protein
MAKNIFEHFGIKNSEHIYLAYSCSLDYFLPHTALNSLHIRYAVIYAILENNIAYLEYLQKIEYEHNGDYLFSEGKNCIKDFFGCHSELFIFIALFTNNSHIISKFYDIQSKNFLAHMARVSCYQIDSLKYVLSLFDTPYVTHKPYNYDVIDIYSDSQINCDDCNILVNYIDVIAYGTVECASLIYNMLPKNYLNKMFRSYDNTDEILNNIKLVRSWGYIFSPDEFDTASRLDNVKTLKYLISINYLLTDTRLDTWKKNPKCKEYLENEMLR